MGGGEEILKVPMKVNGGQKDHGSELWLIRDGVHCLFEILFCVQSQRLRKSESTECIRMQQQKRKLRERERERETPTVG